jgi:hypothetical protein
MKLNIKGLNLKVTKDKFKNLSIRKKLYNSFIITITNRNYIRLNRFNIYSKDNFRLQIRFN